MNPFPVRSRHEIPDPSCTVREGVHFGQGWHRPDVVRWSRGTDASLVFQRIYFPESIDIVAIVELPDVTAEQPRLLTVESPGHPSVTTRISRSPAIVTFPTPVMTGNAPFEQLWFRLNQGFCPFSKWRSADERILGLNLKDILTQEETGLSFPMDFTRPGTAQILLCEGWHGMEEGLGVWSYGDIAEISLPRWLIGPGEGYLLAEISPLTKPPGREPVSVVPWVNGIEQAAWPFESQCQRYHGQLKIPAGAETISIRFHITGAERPDEMGLAAGDTRRLGVMLHSLSHPSAEETACQAETADEPSSPPKNATQR